MVDWTAEAIEAAHQALCDTCDGVGDHVPWIRAALDAAVKAQWCGDEHSQRDAQMHEAMRMARAEALEEAAKAMELEGSYIIARYEAQDIIRALKDKPKEGGE